MIRLAWTEGATYRLTLPDLGVTKATARPTLCKICIALALTAVALDLVDPKQ